MKQVIKTAFALAFGVSTALSAQAAPRVTSPLAGPDLEKLLEVRKAVWVNFFSGDTLSLRRVLPPELVAMGAGDSGWRSLESVLASSARFKNDGGRLIDVRFDSSQVHNVGTTTVMFSRYTLVTADGAGRATTIKGRATEVFVRAGGRWVHTSWHLDQDASSPRKL